MRKTASTIAALTLLGGLLAACSNDKEKTSGSPSANEASNPSSSASNGEPKLSGKIIFATNRTDKADSTIRDLADEFEKLHPGTSVEVEGITDGNTLKTRAAANELPDVGIPIPDLPLEKMPDYYLPQDDLGFSADTISFYDYNKIDGKVYGIPISAGYQGIVYNKKAFAEAGITTAPKTLDEMLADSEKLKEKGIIALATSYKDGWPVGYYTTTLPMEMAGDPDWYSKLADSDTLYNQDNNSIAVLDFLTQMNEKGYLEPDLMSANWENQKRLHAQGKLAMAYLGTWYPSQLADNGANIEDIGMFPFPGIKTISGGPDGSLFISKNTENPDLAKAFVKYCIENGRFAIATGSIPSDKNAQPPAYVTELLSSGLPVITSSPTSSKIQDIINKGNINMTGNLQEYIVSKKDKQADLIAKWNKQFQDAKK